MTMCTCLASDPRRVARRISPLFSLAPVLLALICAGCETPPQSVARAQARQHWNAARAQVKLRLATEQFTAGNVQAAADEATEAARLDPNHPDLPLLQARIWLAQGALERAADLLATTHREGAAQAEVLYLLGTARQQQQRWSEAAEAFRGAVELNASDVTYLVAGVQAQLQFGNPEAALATLTARETQFSWTPAYQAALAECHEQLGNWPEAVSAWQRVVATPGAEADICLRLADALCRAGRPAEAIPVLSRALPGSTAETRDGLRLRLAEAHLAAGQPAAAREQAQLILRTKADDAAALRILALAYAGAGDFRSALRTAQRVLAYDPQHVPTLELVAALAWRAGERHIVVATIEQLTKRDAQNAVAQQLLLASPAIPDTRQ